MAKKKTKSPSLTPKMRCFAEEYLVDFNGTRAYKKAGFKPTSDASAAQLASRMLRNAKVAAFIKAAQDKLTAKAELSAEMVIDELRKIGFSNIDDYATFSSRGIRIKDSKKFTREQLAAVGEISQTASANGLSVKFKLWDKPAALVQLGKHLGLFTDRVDLTTGGKPVSFRSMSDEDMAALVATFAKKYTELQAPK